MNRCIGERDATVDIISLCYHIISLNVIFQGIFQNIIRLIRADESMLGLSHIGRARLPSRRLPLLVLHSNGIAALVAGPR